MITNYHINDYKLSAAESASSKIISIFSLTMMMMISRQQAADQSVSCYDDHDHDDHDNDDDQKAVRRQQTDQSAAVESSANGPASFFSHMPTFSKVHIKLCFIYYVIFISIFIFIFLSSAM